MSTKNIVDYLLTPDTDDETEEKMLDLIREKLEAYWRKTFTIKETS